MNKKFVVGIIIAFIIMLIVGTRLMPVSPAENIDVDTAPPYSGISSDVTLKNVHQPKTVELISMLEHNSELKHLVEKTVENLSIKKETNFLFL